MYRDEIEDRIAIFDYLHKQYEAQDSRKAQLRAQVLAKVKTKLEDSVDLSDYEYFNRKVDLQRTLGESTFDPSQADERITILMTHDLGIDVNKILHECANSPLEAMLYRWQKPPILQEGS